MQAISDTTIQKRCNQKRLYCRLDCLGIQKKSNRTYLNISEVRKGELWGQRISRICEPNAGQQDMSRLSTCNIRDSGHWESDEWGKTDNAWLRVEAWLCSFNDSNACEMGTMCWEMAPRPSPAFSHAPVCDELNGNGVNIFLGGPQERNGCNGGPVKASSEGSGESQTNRWTSGASKAEMTVGIPVTKW